MNLVDRILRTTWRLVLLLLVLAVLLPMVGHLLGQVVAPAASVVSRGVGDLVGRGLAGIVLIVFLIGLGTRLVRSLQDPAAARKRRADHERLRRTPRHRAEDIPPHGRSRRVPEDDDPTLPFGGS